MDLNAQHAPPAAVVAGGPPLDGLRVLDLMDGIGEMCGRYLGDLGADVVRVEPPGGGVSRQQEPVVDGVSLHFLTHNANKRSVEIDVADPAGRDRFWELVDAADIVLDPGPAGWPERSGLSPEAIRARAPRVVVGSLSDYGRTGPYRDWVATEQTHLALGGVLSRSGPPGRPPLLPPGSLAYESAALQCAWAVLIAHAQRLRTGAGDLVDVSVYEATAGVLDPGYGVAGSAAGGVPSAAGPRGRPDARHLYPIFPCADGWVRICILAPRQWAGMFRWLGEPAELSDPGLASMAVRFAATDRIHPVIAQAFAGQTRAEIVAGGQTHGVPTAAVLTPSEVLAADHFASRGVFLDMPADPDPAGPDPAGPDPGRTVPVVNGLVEIDGVRAGLRRPAPRPGEHTAEVFAELATLTAQRGSDRGPEPADPGPGEAGAQLSRRGRVQDPAVRRPLDGVRVLDLGVIVVGAELGRLLADMGAEVTKVEARAFPDGTRQSLSGAAMTAGFAYGHRNKRGLGINLRDEKGRALFRQLAGTADVILSNFKPGTLESLGLGHADLAPDNPGLVMADSSAFGSSGPWSKRMGYGPLVRASSGLTTLWRYPDDEAGFSDASTIYPDHVVARVAAVAVLAMLLRRRRTGLGGTVSVAQIDTILGGLTSRLAHESLVPGSLVAVGNTVAGDAPRGIFPCAGEDEWVVVTVRGESDWQRLAAAIERPDLAADPAFRSAAGRVAGREQLEAALGEWTSRRPPRPAMQQLQAAGVPAAMMQRAVDYPGDPQLSARGFLRTMHQPGVATPMPAESASAVFASMPLPELRPAPQIGQHTREIARDMLALDEAQLTELLAGGVLEEWTESPEIRRTVTTAGSSSL